MALIRPGNTTKKLQAPIDLSPSMSRASSPLHTINEVLGNRTSWPGVSHSLSGRQNSESHSRPTSLTTLLSYTYTVRSINSRKSSVTVLYPHPVQPRRTSSVDAIAESVTRSLESLVMLSSRSASMSVSPQGTLKPVVDKEVSCWCLVVKRRFPVVAYNLRQHIAGVMVALSALFYPSPEDSFLQVEYRLASSWKSLLKIKTSLYEEKHRAPCLRATRTFADSILH
ncbi:hypothetical protein BJV78DRAFT_1216291, partial [Lactifluus subvellereus]